MRMRIRMLVRSIRHHRRRVSSPPWSCHIQSRRRNCTVPYRPSSLLWQDRTYWYQFWLLATFRSLLYNLIETLHCICLCLCCGFHFRCGLRPFEMSLYRNPLIMGLSILSAEIFFFFFLFLFFVPSPFCQHHCCPLRPPKRILSTDPRVRWQWLRLCPPATSLSQSQWCSPRQIGTRWRRGGNVPRSADRSIRKIPIEIRARSMQKLCTDRISIGSSEWWPFSLWSSPVRDVLV